MPLLALRILCRPTKVKGKKVQQPYFMLITRDSNSTNKIKVDDAL